MSRPTYSLVESGERELTVSEAEKLAQVFGVALTDLLAGKAPEYNVSVIRDEARKKKGTDMEIRVEEKHLDKFKDVLLYILERIGAKPNVGETVIYKLLYFIDFDYYEKFEANLLGATYIKNHHGPTPVEFKAVVDKMAKNQELERVKSKYFQYEQKKYLPLKSPDLSRFSAREIQHIDEVIARLGWKTAKELSYYSHTDTPWLVHKEGEPISYESVFYRDKDHSVRNYEDEL
jgi:transcriptional regulator with XRE-family HTH domain